MQRRRFFTIRYLILLMVIFWKTERFCFLQGGLIIQCWWISSLLSQWGFELSGKFGIRRFTKEIKHFYEIVIDWTPSLPMDQPFPLSFNRSTCSKILWGTRNSICAFSNGVWQLPGLCKTSNGLGRKSRPKNDCFRKNYQKTSCCILKAIGFSSFDMKNDIRFKCLKKLNFYKKKMKFTLFVCKKYHFRER